jgi:hypothetical protein
MKFTVNSKVLIGSNISPKEADIKLTNNCQNQVWFLLNTAAQFPYSCHDKKEISSSIPSSTLGGASRI